MADPVLAIDLVTRVFKGLRIGFGEDLIRVIVLRSDNDRRLLALRAALQGRGGCTSGQDEGEGAECGECMKRADHRYLLIDQIGRAVALVVSVAHVVPVTLVPLVAPFPLVAWVTPVGTLPLVGAGS